MSKIYFISDAHLGAEERGKEREKENRLLAFLDERKREGEEVYILGDLFDFFFEYRTVIPARHYRVIEKLSDLVRSGVKVTYVVGNHDYWLGSFFRDELGVKVSQNPCEVITQGKRLFLSHGDDLGRVSLGDRALRTLLRNPITIELFSWIHPDVGAAIARWISGTSRENRKVEMEEKIEEMYGIAKEKFNEGFDGMICGHIHLPRIFHEGGKTFLILGDWHHHFSYGVLNDGKLSLKFYEVNPKSQAPNNK